MWLSILCTQKSIEKTTYKSIPSRTGNGSDVILPVMMQSYKIRPLLGVIVSDDKNNL